MQLQKAGGIAALCEAAIYLGAFVFYGAVLAMPPDLTPAAKLAFLASYQVPLTVMNLLTYVAFGALLAVLTLALHARLRERAPVLAQVGAVFGVVWVGLVIASGMIANTGLAAAIKLSATDPDAARAVWASISAVVEGLGGGTEVVGGLWVLLVSLAALKAGKLPRSLHYLGIVVGAAGILTVFPADVLTEIFGVSQIVWFIWLGIAMLRKPEHG